MLMFIFNTLLYAQEADDYRAKAEQGDVRAQNDLGNLYFNGKGVEKNLGQAVYWFTKAAEQGLATAQYNLGICYSYGTETNPEKAFYWYQKAAEQGHIKAQNDLGSFYFNGKGTSKDLEQAIYWFAKSAEQGLATAQYNLGICYSYGTEPNPEKEFYWYLKAAEQGHIKAQNDLGNLYFNGKGVEKNLGQAVYWFTKSAEQGLATAQYNLGICYNYSSESNPEKAFYWYLKAAEQGHIKAQNDVGSCYYNGKGVKKNEKQAVYWLTKAENQGNEKAKENLKIIKENKIQKRKETLRFIMEISTIVIKEISDTYISNNQDISQYANNPVSNQPSQNKNNDASWEVQSCSHQQQCYKDEAEWVKRWMEHYKNQWVTYYKDKAAGKTGPLYNLNVTDESKQIQLHQNNMKHCRKLCPSIPQSELETITPKAYIKKTWSIDVDY